MITFPASKVKEFKHTNPHLRLGQAFYQFMELHKVTNPEDKEFCDRLYNAAAEKAREMIVSRTDHQN